MTVALAAQSAGAKTLEDVLKEKGVISAEDFQEISKSKPVDYKLGKGFTLTSPDEKFQLSLGGRLQARYTYLDGEVNKITPDSGKFEVKRMKMWMSGYAYTKDLTYLLQVDFAQGGSTKIIDHAYLNYRIIDEIQILAGQTKVPFGRQWLNSSGGQQFVDRSTASDFFRPGYDTGVKLNGELMKGLATYEFGVYGGAGQSATRATTGDNIASAIAARVSVNPFGKMGYSSESDVDNTPKPLLSVGASYYGNTLNKTASTFETNNITLAGANGWLGKGIAALGTTTEKVAVDTYGVDAAFKWRGLSAQAEYLNGEAEGQTGRKHLRADGYYAQVGYFVLPQSLELALRYSFVDPNIRLSNNHIVDTSGAISYFFNKQSLKLQGDITNTHDQSKGRVDDMTYRLQAQVIF
jgi:phosphate-selective porin OprO and OprP